MPDLGKLANKQRSKEIIREFKARAVETTKRVKEIFGIDLTFDNKGITRLDRLISHLQARGMPNDVDLFVHDFGCYLGEILARTLEGQWIVREPLIHSSVSITSAQEDQIEYFPFHKVYKRIIGGSEESLEYFYQDAVSEHNALSGG